MCAHPPPRGEDKHTTDAECLLSHHLWKRCSLASATTPRSKQSISEHHNSCLVRRRGCFIRLAWNGSSCWGTSFKGHTSSAFAAHSSGQKKNTTRKLKTKTCVYLTAKKKCQKLFFRNLGFEFWYQQITCIIIMGDRLYRIHIRLVASGSEVYPRCTYGVICLLYIWQSYIMWPLLSAGWFLQMYPPR